MAGNNIYSDKRSYCKSQVACDGNPIPVGSIHTACSACRERIQRNERIKKNEGKLKGTSVSDLGRKSA